MLIHESILGTGEFPEPEKYKERGPLDRRLYHDISFIRILKIKLTDKQCFVLYKPYQAVFKHTNPVPVSQPISFL